MIKTVTALASLALLAACGGAEEPAPAETAMAPTPQPTESSLEAPTTEIITSLVAEACPDFEPVGNSQCLSQGMGTNAFNCEFSTGDDEYLRNDAEVVLGESGDQWVLADSEKVCAQGA